MTTREAGSNGSRTSLFRGWLARCICPPTTDRLTTKVALDTMRLSRSPLQLHLFRLPLRPIQYGGFMQGNELAFQLKSGVLKRKHSAFFKELMRAQSLPTEQLLELQWKRALDISRFAFGHTRFYPEWFAAHGTGMDEVVTPEDWQRLPILNRTDVKENAHALLSDEATKGTMRRVLTGGSTGEPLRLYHDSRVPSLAQSWRMYSWWGVTPWDNLARVARWGFGRHDTLRNDITWWPTKQRYLDAGLVDDESMRDFHRQLVKTRPRLIEGYIGAMLELADFLERNHLRIDPPLAVATTAAPLSEASRQRLESVFGAPVYDEYRGSEIGWMAGECANQNGLHVFADTRKFEIVDADGRPLPPGQIGDIVITDLTNRVFPLIRYRIGDRGSWAEGACPCGVTLPRIQPPDGRTTDLIRLPSGRTIGHRLMAMFGAHPESVKLFQIHQKADYSITVRVVKGDDPRSDEHIKQAVDSLRERISNEVPVIIEQIDELPYSGGKIKYVISDVPNPT